MSFLAVVFQSWLVGNSLPCYIVTSFLCFVFTSAENMSLLSGWEKALGCKVWWKYYRWERSIKAAEKDPSATIVASIHLTGANVVGSVNVTELFWQRRSTMFTYFAKANMTSFIFTTAQLQNGSCNSTVIYSSPWKPNDLLKYHFCDNYFCICFLQWCAVLHCIQVMY